MYRTAEFNDRILIVNSDSFDLEKNSTENLKNDELMILSCLVKDCPLNRYCIKIDDGVSSICKWLGYPAMTVEKEAFGKMIECNHEKAGHKTYEVQQLEVKNCPDKKTNCIGCNSLKNIITQSYPSKSHCHIVCEAI